MKLVVIESPFRAGHGRSVGENIHYARCALTNSIKRGECPVAFHLLYTQPNVLDDTKPNERELGLHLSQYWWEVADLHAFYTDCGWSGGMYRALQWCREMKRPVDFRALIGEVQQPPDRHPFDRVEAAK